MSRLIMFFFALLTACSAAWAGPIDVAYSVTGAAGAWNLNFTVTNNMTGWPGQDVYEFGVSLSGNHVVGSPTGYDPSVVIPPVTNLFFGGSSNSYNNIWADFTVSRLFPGTSLSGFIAQVADTQAPVSVPWFAYSLDSVNFGLYDGPGAFAVDFDGFGSAGFEGVAKAATSAVPEPSTLAFLAVSLAAGVFMRRKVICG